MPSKFIGAGQAHLLTAALRLEAYAGAFSPQEGKIQ